MAEERFTARYERRGAGWSASTLVAARPVRVAARTLEAARFAMAAALAEATGRRDGWIAIEDDIALSGSASAALAEARTRRDAALQAAADSRAAGRVAAFALKDDGLSLRDSAYLLGLSHSRIQQLIDDRSES